MIKDRLNLPASKGWNTDKPSRTKQSMRDETNINTIMSRLTHQGFKPPVNPIEPRFGAFDSSVDANTQWQRIVETRNAFYELPAALRARFSNDPRELLLFCETPAENYEEGVALGLYQAVADPSSIPETPAQPDGPEAVTKSEGDS